MIPDGIIHAEFAGDGFLRCQQIGNLDIQFFAPPVAYEVDLLVSGSANRDVVASAQQLQIDDVLKNEVDVPCVAAEDRLPYAVVS